MYSFAERADTTVIDEPLYGHYLRVTGADHPGREEVLAVVDSDGDAVMRRLLSADSGIDTELLFMKQMAHHLVDVDTGFLDKTENVFLIRDPEQMLPSLTIQLPHASLSDTGLALQWHLFLDLQRSGQTPAVLDSRQLLRDPERVLRQLCEHLGVGFDAAMLSWPAGPREQDGVWALHWYHAVHKSTGFSEYRHKTEFPRHLEPLLAECRPFYENLYEHALRATNGE